MSDGSAYQDNKKWILNGAHGEYFIGEFDGSDYTPETEGVRYNYGNCFYASQTWSDIPEEDGRRIQIAWGRVNLPDMPFNQMMTFPVSLTLRSTDEGLRIFAYPVGEIEKIHGKEWTWTDEKLEPGENLLHGVEGTLFDIDAEIDLGDADEVGFVINGFAVSYDVKTRRLSTGGNELDEEDEEFGEKPGGKLAPIDGKIRLRVLVDRPSVEIFGNDGRIYMPMQAVRDVDDKSLSVYAKGGNVRVVKLAVREVKSIWP